MPTPCAYCSPEFSCWNGGSCRREPVGTVTLPIADVAALVRLGWELTRYISETDQSATGSIYGIEHAHKTIAKVAVRLPITIPSP